MNKLPLEKRIQIIKCLVEGNSIRGTARLCDVVKNSVIKLLCEVGEACAAYQNDKIRGLTGERYQVDEIWSFVHVKEGNLRNAKAAPVDAGDVWTWTAIDADSKLVATWFVGDRSFHTGKLFLEDLRQRVSNRIQLTSDGWKAYARAVKETFGEDVDFAMLQKLYGPASEGERHYSPPVCVGTKLKKQIGTPSEKHISTSFAERQNLTMRMSMRRFTRLTNAFSKKIENHALAVALHFMHYNFCRIHQSLRMTPAMAAKVTDKLMDVADIVRISDEYWAIKNPPKPRGRYKKIAEEISK